MRITIEDLEALKELNDELEENHVETEKALQDDLSLFSNLFWMHKLTYIPADLRDVQIREHLRKIELLEEGCQDLESTIGQFRELVLQLQMCVIFYQISV